jgi:hypothetical protein
VAAADRAAGAAAAACRDQEAAIRVIQEQLGEALRRLADARMQARQTVAEQRRARQALDRLRRRPPASPGPGRPFR